MAKEAFCNVRPPKVKFGRLKFPSFGPRRLSSAAEGCIVLHAIRQPNLRRLLIYKGTEWQKKEEVSSLLLT